MVNMPRLAFRFRTVARLCRAAAASGFLSVIVFSGTWTSFFGEPGVECLHLMAQCDSGEGEAVVAHLLSVLLQALYHPRIHDQT